MDYVGILQANRYEVDELREWYTSSDTERAGRFTRGEDRDRSLVAAALLRRAVASVTGELPSQIRVSRWCRSCQSLGNHGRPVTLTRLGTICADMHLSASHAGDVVLSAVSTSAVVGVDVELTGGVQFAGFDNFVLSPGERERLLSIDCSRRDVRRTETWTRKEAVLKATGHGLTVDLRKLDIDGLKVLTWPPQLDRDVPAPLELHLNDLAGVVALPPGHVASACVLNASPVRIALLG